MLSTIQHDAACSVIARSVEQLPQGEVTATREALATLLKPVQGAAMPMMTLSHSQHSHTQP